MVNENDRIIDFLNGKIDGIKVDLKEDIRKLSEQIEEYSLEREECKRECDRVFASKSAFRSLAAATALGFIFVMCLLGVLTGAEALAGAIPAAVRDAK